LGCSLEPTIQVRPHYCQDDRITGIVRWIHVHVHHLLMDVQELRLVEMPLTRAGRSVVRRLKASRQGIHGFSSTSPDSSTRLNAHLSLSNNFAHSESVYVLTLLGIDDYRKFINPCKYRHKSTSAACPSLHPSGNKQLQRKSWRCSMKSTGHAISPLASSCIP